MSLKSGHLDNIQVLLENQTLTTSGSTQVNIDTSQYKEFWFTVRIDGPVTGGSPTIEFKLFDLDNFGVSVTGNVTSSGVFTAPIVATSFKHLTQTGMLQFNWTITGTIPSFGGVYAAITGLKDAVVTGQKTMANSTPIVIASDQSSIPVNDGGGSLTVDGSVSITGTPNVNVTNGAGAAAVNIQDGGNSITVDGIVTANQGTSPWVNNITQIGGSSLTLGQKIMANSIPVVLSSDQTVILTAVVSNIANTASITTTSVSTTAVLILAANVNRKGYVITNNGGNNAYIGFSSGVTSSIYSVLLGSATGTEQYEPTSTTYTGAIYAIRGSGTSNITVVEFT